LEGRKFTLAFRYPAPVGDIRLQLRANWGADAFIQGEVFEHEYYRLPLAADPTTILDLGANIGLTAVYFGRLFPRATITCVEPFSGNLHLLNQNLEMNDIRARVFGTAIDLEDGNVVMALDKNDYGHRISSGETVAGEEKLAVPAISVPTLMAKMGWIASTC
jgi:FkbM family methyltransferase